MKILEVMTEHTTPFKILIEVLKEILQETNIEFKCDIIPENNKKNHKNNKNKKNKKVKNISDDEYDSEELIDSSDDEDENNNNHISDNDSDDDSDSDIESDEDSDKDQDDDNDNEDDENDNDDDTKIIDKSGMKIMAVDTTKTVLINLKLEAKNFAKFKCKKKKLVLGVNLVYFHKLIKSMDKDDNLTLYVEHDDKNFLGIKIDNPTERKDSTFKLKLLDLGNQAMNVPDITFDAVVIMNSTEFHKICREMSQIADYVDIKCLKDKIVFTCKGEFAQRTTTYRTGDGEIEGDGIIINFAGDNRKTTSLIVQGIFELRNLVLFSKCASLCNDIEIYMKNNYPLVIKYTVATLGRILLCLTPISEETTKNGDLSDEDDYYSDDDNVVYK